MIHDGRRLDGIGWMVGVGAGVPSGDAWLTAAERGDQTRYRIPKRRAEWRLGRWTAKHAVAAWLGTATPVGEIGILARSADDGFPLVTGVSPVPAVSLSHRSDLAVVAVGPPDAEVGCDVELVEDRSPTFPEDWFTENEQALVREAPPHDRSRLVTLVWSAKESALKALGEGLRLDTRCVEVTVGADRDVVDGWHPLVVAAPGDRSFAGWWRPAGNQVLVVVADRGLLDRPPSALVSPSSTGRSSPLRESA